ncbi:MAG: hypothetical protein ABJA69_00260 [Acidobacteriaceae bacterium]
MLTAAAEAAIVAWVYRSAEALRHLNHTQQLLSTTTFNKTFYNYFQQLFQQTFNNSFNKTFNNYFQQSLSAIAFQQYFLAVMKTISLSVFTS